MAIKPTGPKLPTAGVDGVSPASETKKKVGTAFDASAVERVSSQPNAQAPEVVAAARHVVSELKAGRLERADAPDAAIEHIVRGSATSESERTLRARIEATQLMLGDDPHFVRALNTLIDKAERSAGD